MRKALLAFAILAATQSARGATAYEALQTLGKQKGEAVLDNVTEVRGEKGAPEPRTWKITSKNAGGRAGGKEYSVQGKQITSERAASPSGAAMNMNQLSLDSDGAHTVAERQAKKAGFAYDHASYTLHAGTKSGSPVWEVRLSDEKSASAGRVSISATTGNILSTEGLTNRAKPVAAARPAPAPAPPRAPAPAPEPYVAQVPRYEPAPAPRYQPAPEPRYQPAPVPRYDSEPRYREERTPSREYGSGSGSQRIGDQAEQVFDRVGNHMNRRGHQIGDFFHNLFTGDRRDTAGPHGSRPASDYSPSPAPAPTRRGEEDYVRPSRVRD